MFTRGAAVLVAVLLAGGPAWADPPAPVAGGQVIDLEVMLARLQPKAWDALKGALRRSSSQVVLSGEPAGPFAGVLPAEQNTLPAIIDKLEKRGLAKVRKRGHAQTLNGQPHSFFTGWEGPTPSQTLAGDLPSKLGDLGALVNLLPTALPDGRIRLEVEQDAGPVELTGAVLPGLAPQRVHTTAQVEAGQTFVLGGVRRRETVTERECVPALRGLPYARELFSQESTQEMDCDFILLVRPRVAGPGR
jgi:Flp pilus assembly secretin CpaC